MYPHYLFMTVPLFHSNDSEEEDYDDDDDGSMEREHI